MATTLFSQSGQLMAAADLRVTIPLSPAAAETEGDLNQMVWHLLHVTALVGAAGALQEVRRPTRASVAVRSSAFFIFFMGCGLCRMLLV